MNLWKRFVLKIRGTRDNVDVNSTPSYKIGDSPDFAISAEPITTIPKISRTEEWQSEVVPHERVVVLCFAIWSPPDKLFTQMLTRVAPEFDDIKFWRVDVDDSLDESDPLIANLLGSSQICTTPTLVLLKHGDKVADAIGYRGEEQLCTILKDWSEL